MKLAEINKLLIVIEMGQHTEKGKTFEQINSEQRDVSESSEEDDIRTESAPRAEADLFSLLSHCYVSIFIG